MRSPSLATFLSVFALVGVAVLFLMQGDSDSPKVSALDRPETAAPEAPSIVLAVEDGPRLGGPAEELWAEVQRLRERIVALEEDVERLRVENVRLAGLVDPAAEILEILARRDIDLVAARGRANQTAAIATLRNVTSAQAQVQASGRVDEDQDGTGEYAGFLEMSGALPGRMAYRLVPPVLSGAFRILNENGEATRSGYLFRFYLPGPRGEGIGEPGGGFSSSSGIDPQLAETTWCCYAWPAAEGAGKSTLFMNQSGDVLATDADYLGPGGGPRPDAAFARRGAITGQPAAGGRGSDGNVWRLVN